MFAERFLPQLVRQRPSEEADATDLPFYRKENRRPERLRNAPAAAQLGNHRAKVRTSRSGSRLHPTTADATEAAASDTPGRGDDPRGCCGGVAPDSSAHPPGSAARRSGACALPQALVTRGAPAPGPGTWVGDLPPWASVPHLEDAENDLPYELLLMPRGGNRGDAPRASLAHGRDGRRRPGCTALPRRGSQRRGGFGHGEVFGGTKEPDVAGPHADADTRVRSPSCPPTPPAPWRAGRGDIWVSPTESTRL